MLKKSIVLLAVLLSALAQAGFDEALNALEEKDFARALNEASEAVRAGDPRGNYVIGQMLSEGTGLPKDVAKAVTFYEKAARGGLFQAYSALSLLYAFGNGVEQDREKALAYARLAAKEGDPDGLAMVAAILLMGPMNYTDAKGGTDQAKYRQLAKRPIAEREIDVEAMDSLYLAAEKGQPSATVILGIFLAGNVGEGNRQKLLKLAQRSAGVPAPRLDSYLKIAKDMDRYGSTLTTPKLFADAQSAPLGAVIRLCGMTSAPSENDIRKIKLVSTKVQSPIRKAQYLPSKVPGYEKTFMIAGEWEEVWTYEGCGQRADIPMRFVADGFGGAWPFAELSGKDIPGLVK